jgi:hypothetical protein
MYISQLCETRCGRHCSQPTNLFLLNMAVADFLTLLFVPVLYYFKQQGSILRRSSISAE